MAQLPSLPNNPVIGDPRLVAQLLANDEALRTAANTIDSDQMAANSVVTASILDAAITAAKLLDDAVTAAKIADADKLGLSESGLVRRGKSIIATEESRTNTAFGTLTTPDQVDDIVLPADGLIFVVYQGRWKESVEGAANAAIHLGATEIQSADATTSTGASTGSTRAAIAGGGVGFYRPLTTYPLGLASWGLTTGSGGGDIGSQVTTGQVIGGGYKPMLATAGGTYTQPLLSGGVCIIFAAAGTYDVSVQFKASSGSVTAKERKLWVWTQSF